jgi:hypothetical protein
LTCYCVETSGVQHIDFDRELSNFPFERLKLRASRFEHIRSALHETLASGHSRHLLQALNGLGSRLQYVDDDNLTNDIKAFMDEVFPFCKGSPHLLALSYQDLTKIGRAYEAVASLEILKGRSFGPSAASLLLTSLLPHAVVGWNEASRQRCGFKKNPPFEEFLRRVQEMGLCIARQIPPRSEFAINLEDTIGAQAIAPLVGFILYPKD